MELLFLNAKLQVTEGLWLRGNRFPRVGPALACRLSRETAIVSPSAMPMTRASISLGAAKRLKSSWAANRAAR